MAFLRGSLAARALLIAVPLLHAAPALADDLTSASFRLRAAHESSLGARMLSSAGPRFSASGVSIGQSDALGFSGAAETLATAAPGFWPIAAGSLPNHDVDGDGIASWLDEDDDGDGLLDAVERNTGVFVSASDPGTSAVNPDSDGDGFADDVELAAGSDPNDPESTPAAPEIPAVPGGLGIILALLLAVAPGMLPLAQRRSRC